MTINVVNGLAATAGAANARQVDGAEKSADGSGVSQIASAKHELNVQILQASAAVSLSAGNDSQALLFRTGLAVSHCDRPPQRTPGANPGRQRARERRVGAG